MGDERTQLIAPAVASAAAVHAAVALTTVAQTVTTGITSPACYRAVSVTGNQASVAGSVVVTGTDWSGATITDTLTLSGTATVAGVRAFKTVTSIALPALTGAGDTVSVGIADVFGLYADITASGDVMLQERAASGTTEFTIEATGTVDVTNGTVATTIVAGDRVRWTYLGTDPTPSGFVSLATFEARYAGTIPAADESRLEALLSDASALVSELAGTDYETVAAPATIISIVCEMVRRVYDNPNGLQGETIGDYTWRGGAATSSGLYLTAQESRTIRRAAGRLGVGSITLTSCLPAPALDPMLGALCVDGDAL